MRTGLRQQIIRSFVLLNSSFFKFDLPYIGPSVDYLGSASTPIFIDLEKALDNASKIREYLKE
jgi:hypothetical protein